MTRRLIAIGLMCGFAGLAGCAKQPSKVPAEAAKADAGAKADAPKASDGDKVSEGPKLVAPTDKPKADDAAAAADKQPLPTEKIVAAAQPGPPEEVMLGTADLTHGIPGKGPLKPDEIKKWLAEPKNMAVLKPALPMGLSAGAGQIAGLEENPLTRAKIELGRQLYFDTRLSNDNTVSCASCHSPEFGYAKNTQFGVGTKGQTGKRNSPVAYNRILSSLQFWDGRAARSKIRRKGRSRTRSRCRTRTRRA